MHPSVCQSPSLSPLASSSVPFLPVPFQIPVFFSFSPSTLSTITPVFRLLCLSLMSFLVLWSSSPIQLLPPCFFSRGCDVRSVFLSLSSGEYAFPLHIVKQKQRRNSGNWPPWFYSPNRKVWTGSLVLSQLCAAQPRFWLQRNWIPRSSPSDHRAGSTSPWGSDGRKASGAAFESFF